MLVILNITSTSQFVNARFDTFAVLFDSSARFHKTLAIAIVKIPFHKKPNICFESGIKRLSVVAFMINIKINENKYPNIIVTHLLLRYFWLSAVNIPYDIAPNKQSKGKKGAYI